MNANLGDEVGNISETEALYDSLELWFQDIEVALKESHPDVPEYRKEKAVARTMTILTRLSEIDARESILESATQTFRTSDKHDGKWQFTLLPPEDAVRRLQIHYKPDAKSKRAAVINLTDYVDDLQIRSLLTEGSGTLTTIHLRQNSTT